MAGAIPLMPDIASGGLKSVEDLYKMINGETTTQNGGGSTVTQSSGISQDSMSALMKSALDSTSGLAAIAGGQRAVGGYNSSVNTLLTNDLLSRTAQQIAASNKTTVTRTDQNPVTKTIGGVSVPGVGKTAGFLGALQLLGKTGAGGGDFNWLKKLIGSGQAATGGGSGSVTPEQSDMLQFGISPTGAASSNTTTSAVASGGGSTASNPAQFDFSSLLNGIDSTNLFGSSPSLPSDAITGNNFNSSAPIDTSAPTDNSTPTASLNIPDYIAPIDDSLILPPTTLDQGYADGGTVTRKKALGLGSQSQGSAGGYSGSGENSVASGGGGGSASVSSSSPGVGSLGAGQSAARAASADFNTLAAPSEHGDSQSDADRSSTATGSLSDISLGGIGRGLGIAGSLFGNSSMSQAGTIGSILGSDNPIGSTALAVGNTLSGGKIGSAVSAFTDPSLTNLANMALSAAVPGYAVANSVAGLFGKTVNPAQIAANYNAINNPNNPMTPEQQSMAAADKANSAASANDMAQFGADTSAAPASGDTQDGRGGNTGSMGADTSASTSTSASETASNDSAGEANGGAISGPGTGVSDSIPTNLSDGEFVIPADVTDMIGRDKLQSLIDKYHMPASIQKLRGVK